MGAFLKREAWATTREHIDRDGCVVLRDALDGAVLAGFHEQTSAFFEEARAINDDAHFSERLKLPVEWIAGHLDGMRKRGVIHNSLLSQFVYGDMTTMALEFARQLGQPELRNAIEQVLGPDVFLHTNNLAARFRKQSAPEVNLPFHQDSFYWREPEIFDGLKPVMLILWSPFTAVNDKVPGMELVQHPIEKEFSVASKPETQFGHLEIGDGHILAEHAGELWYPHMNAGDLCVFGERLLHRSFPNPTSNATRTSIDLRVLSRHKVPRALKGHAGIMLETLENITLS